jgi:hypothetical protein
MYSEEYINSLTHTGLIINIIIVVVMMKVFAIALSPLKLSAEMAEDFFFILEVEIPV